MNIAQRLNDLLKTHNMSRSKLAREIGVHTSTVSNWLEGKEVRLDNLQTLCDYFNCSLDYFSNEKENPAPTIEDGKISKEDLFNAYKSAPEHVQVPSRAPVKEMA